MRIAILIFSCVAACFAVFGETPQETYDRLGNFMKLDGSGMAIDSGFLENWKNIPPEKRAADLRNLYLLAEELRGGPDFFGSDRLWLKPESVGQYGKLPYWLDYYERGMSDPGTGFVLEHAEPKLIPELTLIDAPILDGSTSTKPLRIALMARLFGTACPHWNPVRGFFANRNELFPEAAYGAGREGDFAMTLINQGKLVENRQTAGSYTQLRRNPEQRIVINAVSPAAKMTDGLDDLSKFEYKVIGYDALVCMVHFANPTGSLTREELRRIYRSAPPPKWEELGKKEFSGAALPLWRNLNSGTGILMRDLLFDGDDAVFPKGRENEHMIRTMNGLLDQFHYKTRAIGFSLWYYEANIYRRVFTRPVAVDGVKPTRETIADGSYPLRAPIYAVISKSAAPMTRRVYELLTEPAGQQIVAGMGYVPLK